MTSIHQKDDSADYFPISYRQALSDLHSLLTSRSWTLEYGPTLGRGSDGGPLRTQVALRQPRVASNRALVISTGLHGIEGFWGAAFLRKLAECVEQSDPNIRVIFLQALNPYGFDRLRRVNEENVDLNRNFKCDGDYQGAPELYKQLDRLLNPKRSPGRFELFEFKAILAAVRFGFARVQAAIAGGQYDYPQGLFYGGSEISWLATWLRERTPIWLDGIKHALHLDVHTGLGKQAEYQMLVETVLPESKKSRFIDLFGKDRVVDVSPGGTRSGTEEARVYQASGSFGNWCSRLCLQELGISDYLFSVAEFGTYPPIRVLKALRRENQEFHWGKSRGTNEKASQQREKTRLLEAFCPSSPRWRQRCLEHVEEIWEKSHLLLEESSA